MQTKTELMLASAVVHLLEARSPRGHPADLAAARTCLAQVATELAGVEVLLPRPREGSAAELLGAFITGEG